jgi:SPP1 gp7 family putative phage head morphogenesis protein
MPPAEAQRVMERFRRAVLAGDAQAATALVNAYGGIWSGLESEILGLLELAEERGLTLAQVYRLDRYKVLQARVAEEIGRYNVFAEQRIIEAQRSAVGVAQQGTRAVVGASLPNGITMELLAEVGIPWTPVATEALESFVGLAGDGGPLSRLLEPLGAEAHDGIRQGIAEGIVKGRNPRQTAALIRDRFGMPLTRSLAISRTETLRAYRESSRLQYAGNPNIVKGYRRYSAQDERVCMACIALDGTVYENDTPLDAHVNCRCALVPETVSYKDLGFDLPEQPVPPTARDWFQGQGEETQRRMMGPGRFDAWSSGQVRLEDMAKVVHDDVWGDAAIVKPLKELVG